MKTVLALVCFIATINVCTAYVCLIDPQQRGSMGDLNTVGSFDCRMTVKPCGGRQRRPGIPVPTYKAESNITITFQKNMDFWSRSNPGYFAVNLLLAYDTFGMELTRVEDNGEPSLFVYTVSVTLPVLTKTFPYPYEIEVEYITNNPEAPVFYACADIVITK